MLYLKCEGGWYSHTTELGPVFTSDLRRAHQFITYQTAQTKRNELRKTGIKTIVTEVPNAHY